MITARRIALVCVLAVTLGAGIDDYLQEMKTTKDRAAADIQHNFVYGSFSYPSACSAIPAGRRAAIVRAVGEFAKTVTASEVFKQFYEEYRTQNKPQPPEAMPTMAESRNQQIVQLKQQIADQEKAQAKAPADQKAIYNDILKALRSTLKEFENADRSQDAAMDEYMQQANEQASREYAQKLASFERDFPAGNPRPLIKRRLQEFLDATKDVDFGAKLVRKEKVMVFEKEEYENKEAHWKLAFRAGKEATDAGRAFARAWLKEL